jgi:iron complex transport system ATP-binding protein
VSEPVSEASSVLALCGVRAGFPDRPDFLGPLDLDVKAGEFWGVLGPNGAGKSTLLRVIVGLLPPSAGDVRLMGRSWRHTPVRERARNVAFLPQQPGAPAFATAGEVVLLGRHPHRRGVLFDSPEDLAAVRQVLQATRTDSFADRRLETLSGGETQRVHVAAALAQEPRLLVLDEPTAALDLYHQFAVFDLLRQQARDTGLSLVAATHDLNLAGRYCDRLLLLRDGQVAACGRREDVLRPSVLEAVYHVQFVTHADADGGHRWVLPVERAEEAGP